MMKIETMSGAIEDILQDFGLTKFSAQTSRIMTRNAVSICLMSEFQESVYQDLVAQNLEALFSPILKSPAVIRVLSQKDAKIADLEREVEVLAREIKALIPYKNHFEVEMKLRSAK